MGTPINLYKSMSLYMSVPMFPYFYKYIYIYIYDELFCSYICLLNAGNRGNSGNIVDYKAKIRSQGCSQELVGNIVIQRAIKKGPLSSGPVSNAMTQNMSVQVPPQFLMQLIQAHLGVGLVQLHQAPVNWGLPLFVISIRRVHPHSQ